MDTSNQNGTSPELENKKHVNNTAAPVQEPPQPVAEPTFMPFCNIVSELITCIFQLINDRTALLASHHASKQRSVDLYDSIQKIINKTRKLDLKTLSKDSLAVATQLPPATFEFGHFPVIFDALVFSGVLTTEQSKAFLATPEPDLTQHINKLINQCKTGTLNLPEVMGNLIYAHIYGPMHQAAENIEQIPEAVRSDDSPGSPVIENVIFPGLVKDEPVDQIIEEVHPSWADVQDLITPPAPLIVYPAPVAQDPPITPPQPLFVQPAPVAQDTLDPAPLILSPEQAEPIPVHLIPLPTSPPRQLPSPPHQLPSPPHQLPSPPPQFASSAYEMTQPGPSNEGQGEPSQELLYSQNGTPISKDGESQTDLTVGAGQKLVVVDKDTGLGADQSERQVNVNGQQQEQNLLDQNSQNEVQPDRDEAWRPPSPTVQQSKRRNARDGSLSESASDSEETSMAHALRILGAQENNNRGNNDLASTITSDNDGTSNVKLWKMPLSSKEATLNNNNSSIINVRTPKMKKEIKTELEETAFEIAQRSWASTPKTSWSVTCPFCFDDEDTEEDNDEDNPPPPRPQYDNIRKYNAHYISEHIERDNQGKYIWRCFKCKFKFTSRGGFNCHVKQSDCFNDKDAVSQAICPMCSLKFKRVFKLHIHLQSAHKDEVEDQIKKKKQDGGGGDGEEEEEESFRNQQSTSTGITRRTSAMEVQYQNNTQKKKAAKHRRNDSETEDDDQSRPAMNLGRPSEKDPKGSKRQSRRISDSEEEMEDQSTLNSASKSSSKVHRSWKSAVNEASNNMTTAKTLSKWANKRRANVDDEEESAEKSPPKMAKTARTATSQGSPVSLASTLTTENTEEKSAQSNGGDPGTSAGPSRPISGKQPLVRASRSRPGSGFRFMPSYDKPVNTNGRVPEPEEDQEAEDSQADKRSKGIARSSKAKAKKTTKSKEDEPKNKKQSCVVENASSESTESDD